MQKNTVSDNQTPLSSPMVSTVEPIVIKPNDNHLEIMTESRDLLISSVRRCESMPNTKLVIITAGDGYTVTVHAPAICLDREFSEQSIRPWYSIPNISINNNMMTFSECKIECTNQIEVSGNSSTCRSTANETT